MASPALHDMYVAAPEVNFQSQTDFEVFSQEVPQ